MIVKMYEFTLVTFIKFLPALLNKLQGSGAAEFIDLPADKSVLLRVGRGPLAALPMTYAASYAGRAFHRAGSMRGAADRGDVFNDINEHFLYTRHTVFMKGWTPETEMSSFERIVRQACGGSYLLEYTDAGYGQGAVPVNLKNNAFVSAFEHAAAPADTPVYGRRDPTPALALLYFIFFGLIAGDAGYGLFLLVGTALALKSRAKARARKFLRLLHFLGYSAVSFGTLYGRFFGRVFFTPVLTPDGLKPVLAAKPGVVETLVLAAVFGVLHAAAGYAAKQPARNKNGSRRKISEYTGMKLFKNVSRPRRFKPRGRIIADAIKYFLNIASTTPFLKGVIKLCMAKFNRGIHNFSQETVDAFTARFLNAAETIAGNIFSYALLAAFVLTGRFIAAAISRAAFDAAGAGTALNMALTIVGGFIDIGFICAGVFIQTRRARFGSRHGGGNGGKMFTPF